jgi:ATP-dependent Clp protease ATP-binding subunit ClpC
MQGYNFTERVRRVLARAREKAADLGNDYVSPEHILISLLAEDDGVCVAVVKNLGAIPEDVSREVEERIARGPRGRAESGKLMPYTSAAKRVLELAMGEARKMDHSYVGTEHLLVAVARQGSGDSAFVLGAHDLTAERIANEVARLLTGMAALPSRDATPAVDQPVAAMSSIARRSRTAVLLSALALIVAVLALGVALARR